MAAGSEVGAGTTITIATETGGSTLDLLCTLTTTIRILSRICRTILGPMWHPRTLLRRMSRRPAQVLPVPIILLLVRALVGKGRGSSFP